MTAFSQIRHTGARFNRTSKTVWNSVNLEHAGKPVTGGSDQCAAGVAAGLRREWRGGMRVWPERDGTPQSQAGSNLRHFQKWARKSSGFARV